MKLDCNHNKQHHMKQLLLFLTSISTSTSLQSPLDCRRMTANLSISSGVEIHRTGDDFNIACASASLGWFPRESFRQKVRHFQMDSYPQLTRSNVVDEDLIELEWDDVYHPGAGDQLTFAEFNMNCVVETTNDIIPVRQKVRYPCDNHIVHVLDKYLQSRHFANKDARIHQLAHSLAGNKNDLYQVVFALADWVSTNVEYSLESVETKTIKTSSEVLSTMEGKCDELTSLFVSMNRSLGIPSRFVSGFAYNDDMNLFDERWVPHTWAEVYFHGVGWVPFDMAYKSFGYIDTGHVQLTTSVDAEILDVEYHAKGIDFDLKAIEVDTLVEPNHLVPDNHNTRDGHIDIELNTQANVVGFGSDAVVICTVRNNKDYYVATQLQLTYAEGMTLLNQNHDVNILLEPFETLEIPFFFNIDGNHYDGYTYNYPISVTSKLASNVDEVNIAVKASAPVFYANI